MTMIEWMMVALSVEFTLLAFIVITRLRQDKAVKRTVDLLRPRLWISVCDQIVDGKPVREVPKAAQVCLLDSSDHLTSHHHWDCDTNEWNGCHTVFITNGASIIWSMQLTYRMYKGDTLTVKGREVQQLVSNVACRSDLYGRLGAQEIRRFMR